MLLEGRAGVVVADPVALVPSHGGYPPAPVFPPPLLGCPLGPVGEGGILHLGQGTLHRAAPYRWSGVALCCARGHE